MSGVPVTFRFVRSHVFTMSEPSEMERPVILLSWEEARLLARLLGSGRAACPYPVDRCLGCGFAGELEAALAERGGSTPGAVNEH